MERVQQEVRDYISNNINENLKKAEITLENVKKDYEKNKNDKMRLEESIRAQDEYCKSQESGKRDLENNLDLMRKQEDIGEINEKLGRHRQSLKDMKFDKLQNEYHTLQKEKENYEKEVSILIFICI